MGLSSFSRVCFSLSPPPSNFSFHCYFSVFIFNKNLFPCPFSINFSKNKIQNTVNVPFLCYILVTILGFHSLIALFPLGQFLVDYFWVLPFWVFLIGLFFVYSTRKKLTTTKNRATATPPKISHGQKHQSWTHSKNQRSR